MLNPYLQVALGGAIGATARYAVSRAIAWHGPGFPIATGIVNVTGSFCIGLLVTIFALRGGHPWAPLLVTGMLGGFTTFSAFSLDTMTLVQRGQAGSALLYVLLSVGLSLMAVVAGLAVGRAALA